MADRRPRPWECHYNGSSWSSRCAVTPVQNAAIRDGRLMRPTACTICEDARCEYPQPRLSVPSLRRLSKAAGCLWLLQAVSCRSARKVPRPGTLAAGAPQIWQARIVVHPVVARSGIPVAAIRRNLFQGVAVAARQLPNRASPFPLLRVASRDMGRPLSGPANRQVEAWTSIA